MKQIKDRMIFQTEETRNLILDAAWKMFLERGFFDVQMIDVATATGLSRTSLYRYFRDKADLAMALMERIFETLRADSSWLNRTDGTGRPIDGLDALGDYLKGHWLSPKFRDQFVFLAEFDAYFSGSRVPPDFKEELNRILHTDKEEVLETLLERAAKDGSIRPGLDLHLTMATLLNAVRGLQQRLLLRGDVLVEVKPGELEKMPLELVDYLIEGLRNREGAKR
jgi:AcrR family transcriptional regulator